MKRLNTFVINPNLSSSEFANMKQLLKRVHRILAVSQFFSIRHVHQALSKAHDQTANSSHATSKHIKPYEEIPSKKSILPAALQLLLSGGPDYLHTHCDRRHNELGPIYRNHLGNVEIVFLSDTKHIQTVVSNEGQYPHHNVPEAWRYYNQVHNIERGLFFQMGEPWLRLRKVFNQVMLGKANLRRFNQDLLSINDDLLASWRVKYGQTNNPETDHCVVPDVKAALCNWSIESTGCMLFRTRMGCVPNGESKDDPMATKLVEHVSNMFTETSKFQIIPVRLAHKLKLKSWKRFERATDEMLRIANLYVAKNLQLVMNAEPASGSILAEMMRLSDGQISQDEISRSLVDLIIAAADTTSAALQWMLYLLAKHQDVQSRILAELSVVFSGATTTTTTTTAEKLSENLPLLKAFIRESLRLYPTAPFLARTLDRDIVLGGYNVPAGKVLVFSLLTTSQMEKYFDKPLEFNLERWIRSSNQTSTGPACPNRSRQHAYASLPFGVGKRSCVGRRAAELQMLVFLASFLNKFHCSLSRGDNDNTKVKLKMILAPTEPISIKLKSR